MRQSLTCLPALALCLLLAPAARGQTLQGQDEQASCMPELAAAETRYHLPPGLLLAMALVESGRRDNLTGLIAPWPWTIQVDGHSHFYPTSADAIRETKTFLQGGNGFVDVGCLQVDLFHHPDAFHTLERAFDPASNIDYAAQYLAGLAHTRGSWLEAVAAYNAGDPSDGIDYLGKVLYLWKGIHLTSEAAKTAPANPAHVGFALQPSPEPLDVAASLFAQHDYPAALSIYTEQLRHHPDDVTALMGAASVLAAQGHGDAARNRLELALTAAPGNSLVLEELLRQISALPPERQLTALLSAYHAAPSVADLPARIALLQAEGGNLDDAVANMAEAVRLQPDDPIRQLDYALLLDRSGDAAAARDAYRAFIVSYRPGRSPTLTASLDQVRQRLAYLEKTTP
jgi:tetratricopeptide (TPR) repeat protein